MYVCYHYAYTAKLHQAWSDHHLLNKIREQFLKYLGIWSSVLLSICIVQIGKQVVATTSLAPRHLRYLSTRLYCQCAYMLIPLNYIDQHSYDTCMLEPMFMSHLLYPCRVDCHGLNHISCLEKNLSKSTEPM